MRFLKILLLITEVHGCEKMTEFYKTCYETIQAQRSSIANTIDAVDTSQVNSLLDRERVIFVGCGDSYAVADYGRWCMSTAGISSVCLMPQEIRYVPIHRDVLVVGISASGRSLVTIDALERAKSMGAETVILTDNPQGEAAKNADHVWATKAGASTYDTSPSSPTTTAMAYLLKLLGSMKSRYQEIIERDIEKLTSHGEHIVTWAEEEGAKIGRLVQEDAAIYLISEGPNYAAAQLGMMKFNEYSLVRGIVAGREEFRHHYNLAVKPTDGAVLISDSPPRPEDEVFMNVVTETLGMNACHLRVGENLNLGTPIAQAIPNTIALQMGAYHSALRLNPDKTQFKEPHASAFRIY